MKNLLKEILSIDNKADLDLVVDAVKMARAHINNDIIAEAKAFFSVGDAVLFKGKAGVKKGVISKMKIKRALVDIDDPFGRTTTWDVPLTMLEAA